MDLPAKSVSNTAFSSVASSLLCNKTPEAGKSSEEKKIGQFVGIVEFAFRMFPFITHFEEYRILQQTLLFAFLVGPCAFVVWRTRFFGPITSTRTGLIRDHFSYGFRRKFDAGP